MGSVRTFGFLDDVEEDPLGEAPDELVVRGELGPRLLWLSEEDGGRTGCWVMSQRRTWQSSAAKENPFLRI